jgi:hypothetical protein
MKFRKGQSGNPRGRPRKHREEAGPEFDYFRRRFKEWLDLRERRATEKISEQTATIYIIEAPGMGRYKVGFTGDIRRRFASLQVGSPIPLAVIATFPGNVADEREIHRKYAAFSAHGEWFDLTQEQVAEIITEYGNQTPQEVAEKTHAARAVSIKPEGPTYQGVLFGPDCFTDH